MTVGMDWHEGVQIDWSKTDYAVVPAVWAEGLPLPQGHCNYNVTSKRWETRDYPHNECPDWRSHPTRRGKPAFLRFIHAFADQLTDLPFPFAGDDSILIIDPGRSVTTDGRRASCEIYLVKNEAGDYKIAFRIFLIRTQEMSVIECYDERYLDACIAAHTAVGQSYRDEEENT